MSLSNLTIILKPLIKPYISACISKKKKKSKKSPINKPYILHPRKCPWSKIPIPENPNPKPKTQLSVLSAYIRFKKNKEERRQEVNFKEKKFFSFFPF
jgi:hypothetical protein